MLEQLTMLTCLFCFASIGAAMTGMAITIFRDIFAEIKQRKNP